MVGEKVVSKRSVCKLQSEKCIFQAHCEKEFQACWYSTVELLQQSNSRTCCYPHFFISTKLQYSRGIIKQSAHAFIPCSLYRHKRMKGAGVDSLFNFNFGVQRPKYMKISTYKNVVSLKKSELEFHFIIKRQSQQFFMHSIKLTAQFFFFNGF